MSGGGPPRRHLQSVENGSEWDRGQRVPNRDLRGKLVILGSGTSVGVPALGCDCPVCTSGKPRNQRLRCAVLCGLDEGHLLIDTPPDLRTQLLRERIGIVHAVVYTHEHADHLFGLDDLRLFPFHLGHPVPIYCEPPVEAAIRRAYAYAFDTAPATHPGATPQIELHSITTDPFELLGATITPLRLQHGPRFEVLGFRIGNVAYCTDTSGIPPATWERLDGVEVLIIDALRHRPHPTHLSLDQAIEIVRRVGARRGIFTHLSHDFDYDETNARLPEGMELAYDGMEIPLV